MTNPDSTTHSDTEIDPINAARSNGGLIYTLARLMEQHLEERDIDHADLFLAGLATIKEHVDDMTEPELRALFDGLFANIIDIRRGRHRQPSPAPFQPSGGS